jgi:hypothetical protein
MAVLSSEHYTSWPELKQFAAAVENVEIANLKRLQFYWFAGKTNSTVPEDLRGRSKGVEGTDPSAFGPQILRSRGRWLKGPEDQRFVGRELLAATMHTYSSRGRH